MTTKLYLDKGVPFATAYPERLSDGSEAWNVSIGGRYIPFRNEKLARDFVVLLGAALEKGTNESVLVL